MLFPSHDRYDEDYKKEMSRIQKEAYARIPEEEKDAFKSFFKDNIVVDDGKVYFGMEIDGKNLQLKQALEQLYLLYKKGDIAAVAKNLQQANHVKKLRFKARQAGPTPPAGTPPAPAGSGDGLLEVF